MQASNEREWKMNDVGEDGVFFPFLDFVFFPIVCEFIACFLPQHALFDPFWGAPIGNSLLPVDSLSCFTGGVKKIEKGR